MANKKEDTISALVLLSIGGMALPGFAVVYFVLSTCLNQNVELEAEKVAHKQGISQRNDVKTAALANISEFKHIDKSKGSLKVPVEVAMEMVVNDYKNGGPVINNNQETSNAVVESATEETTGEEEIAPEAANPEEASTETPEVTEGDSKPEKAEESTPEVKDSETTEENQEPEQTKESQDSEEW